METVAQFHTASTTNMADRVFTPDQSGKPVLIALMPTLDKLRLTNRLIGAIQAAFPRMNARAYQALRALLSHCGYHSNRVWASLKRLGKLIVGQDDKSRDQGYKLAERGIGDLIEAGLVRVIDDEKELLAGPGEHDFLASGKDKQGDGAVNHYDLSLLLPFIDEQDRNEWAILMQRKEERRSPEPPSDLAAVWEGSAAFPAAHAPQSAADEYDDPFASEEELAQKAERIAARQAIAEMINVSPNNSASNSADSPASLPVSASLPACNPSLSMESAHHIEPCNVTQTQINNETKRTDGAQPSAAAGRFFVTTEVSSITRGERAPTYTRETTEHKAEQASYETVSKSDNFTVFGLLTRTRANGGFGLDKPGAQRLVTDHSDTLLRDVLEYIRALEAQGGEPYGPGRVTKTINAIAGGSEFPQWYREMQEKRRRQADRERRRAEREAAKPIATVHEGIAEPLKGIWRQFLEEVRSVEGIAPGFWATNLVPLKTVTVTGDVVTIETLFPQSYIKLADGHTGTFAGILTRLMGRPVKVTFTKPKGKE